MINSTILSRINSARASRKAIAVVTSLRNGNKRLIEGHSFEADELATSLLKRSKSGKSGIDQLNGEEQFVQIYLPPPRLIIVGAVHISQVLAPLAKACDFDVTIVDPRTAFATSERFPDTNLYAEWPSDILNDLSFDPFTALVLVTHDPKIDDIPLIAGLRAKCFYIGALGSRKTHAKRIARITNEGFSKDALAQIDAPIGLDIGSANPAEIAVAVMGQIICSLRKPASNDVGIVRS